jgi:dipeptidyl aminopeptidase/acylaminoacyl peptidase
MFNRWKTASAPLALILLASVSRAPAQAADGVPFTLERVMSAPFPSSLVAARSGGLVAWVFNARGVRNVWVAGPPEYRGRAVTAYTEDDGIEITELAFTPDARSIVFVRGGAPNGAGEFPNPSGRTEAFDQSLWIVSLEGGPPRRLADGSSPAISPQGDRVAYVQKDRVAWTRLDGSTAPETLMKPRGGPHSLRWSPDGTLLAFVSARGDHDFVGVLDPHAKSVRYLDPSVDSDGEPVWSPDGRRIAFLRVAASRTLFTFGPQREAQPWSIRVADVATGAGREVWKADAGRGSAFHGIVGDHQILWAADDRIVFPWEKTGWVHLYSVPTAGGVPTALTSGEFEVEYVALTPDRQSVLLNSNQDDVNRRHVWRVSLTGGPPTQVTSGNGLEWSPVVTSDGKVALLRSDARRAGYPALVEGSATRELAPGATPADFPAAALVEPEAVVFPASDGLPIHGQLFKPRDLPAGERRPAVAFFHGGSRRQMLLGWHYMDYYSNSYAMNQYLASRGYVVLSVNYRSGIGYGLDFREAENYGAHGASEMGDVLGAGLYLRGRADVDPAAIGLWGGSYGGYLTAMGLARASDLFAAGVDVHGVHDWNVVIRNFAPTYDPLKQPELARRAFESSPLASVASWRSPVLLIHGDDDRNVPFSESVDLVEELRKRGIEPEQLVFPDEVHDLLLHRSWLRAYAATADFFDRTLKSKGKKRN